MMMTMMIWDQFLIKNYCQNKKAVLSQEEPRDAAVNSNMYRMLQRHRSLSLPQTFGFLIYIGDHSNAEITHITLILTAVT